MKAHPTNPKVDNFLEQAEEWQVEFEKLRAIALSCGLTEELKWGHERTSLPKASERSEPSLCAARCNALSERVFENAPPSESEPLLGRVFKMVLANRGRR